MGKNVVSDFKNARLLMGLSPQELNFDVFFSIRQLLILQAGYYGIQKAEAIRRADLMLSQFGLEDKANNTARELSGGMKRRVQLAKSLVHDPPVVILDEPTAGVDIELRHMLWIILKKLNSQGKTILLTTHYIEEAEAICDEVSIIDGGKIITQDSPQSLINTIGTGHIEIKLQEIPPNFELNGWTSSILDDSINIHTSTPESDMPKIMVKFIKMGLVIEEIKTCKSSLEDVFLKLTGHSIHDKTVEDAHV